MKFWKRLRWIASILFVAAMLLSWLSFDSSSTRNSKPSTELRLAPTFSH
jgi:hypothetical protein